MYEGTFKNNDGRVIKVAVKTLKDDMNESSRDELLREGNVMMGLEHENVVKFIGISWHPEIHMVIIMFFLLPLRFRVAQIS